MINCAVIEEDVITNIIILGDDSDFENFPSNYVKIPDEQYVLIGDSYIGGKFINKVPLDIPTKIATEDIPEPPI